jgi:hypothetical protein
LTSWKKKTRNLEQPNNKVAKNENQNQASQHTQAIRNICNGFTHGARRQVMRVSGRVKTTRPMAQLTLTAITIAILCAYVPSVVLVFAALAVGCYGVIRTFSD